MSFIKNFIELLKRTVSKWWERDPVNNSIILAYYTIFSLPGLLVVILSITGYFFDKDSVTTDITNEIQHMIGGDAANDIRTIIENASKHKSNVIASILGVATLIFGATGVFNELQQMLNRIWETTPQTHSKRRLLVLVINRLFSFGLVLVVGFLMLVSLVLSAVLSAFSTWVTNHFSFSINLLFMLIDFIVTLGVITILVAAIFKYLPDTKIPWKNVLPGSFLTSLLFVVAQSLLGFYFGRVSRVRCMGQQGPLFL